MMRTRIRWIVAAVTALGAVVGGFAFWRRHRAKAA
jgi:hypothetical protein